MISHGFEWEGDIELNWLVGIIKFRRAQRIRAAPALLIWFWCIPVFSV